MKDQLYIPDVVDFAHQIINLHRENEQLRGEVEHYKKLHEMHLDDLSRRDKHTNEMTGILLEAVFDPESVINKGNAAIIRESIKG